MDVNFQNNTAVTLGKKSYESFCHWNAIEIERKKAVQIYSKRDDWRTKDNFATMYDGIYKTMARAGVAEELPECVLQDRKGNTALEHDPKRYGRKTNFKLTHTERVLFVDEVEENTSQKQDSRIGGRKLIVTRGTRSQERSSYRDCHFTVLGFTAALGEPMMCAVIVAAKKLTAIEASGFNPLSTGMDEPRTLKEKSGHKKYKQGGCERMFPIGPTCIFEGKVVPTFVCCTDNGSITSTLLAAMLKRIDGLGVLPRN
jgi:hypothetical protein